LSMVNINTFVRLEQKGSHGSFFVGLQFEVDKITCLLTEQ